MSERRSRSLDAVFGLATAGIAAVFLFESRSVRKTPFDSLGAAYLPRLVAAALLALGLLVVGRALLGLKIEGSEVLLLGGRDGADAGTARRTRTALGLVLLTLSYVCALQLADMGFLLPTIVYLAGASFLLSTRSRRDAVVAAATGAGLALASELIFKTVLKVALP